MIGAVRRSGFTLVEVLVGLVVASLALAVGFGALAFTGDRASHAEAATVAALDDAGARTLLVDWLTGARLRYGQERFQGLAGDGGIDPSDELVLPTNARTPLDEPVTVVRLFVDTDAATPERGLVAELIGRPGSEPRLMELVPGAGRMQIRYFVNAQTAGTAEWREEWLENALPDGVELTLVPARGDTLPLLLRLPIRVAMEAIR